MFGTSFLKNTKTNDENKNLITNQKEMKKLLLLIIALSTSLSFKAQTIPQVEWTKSIGGTGNERSNGVTTDQEGNIIIVGRFQSPTMQVDQVTLTKNNLDKEDVADVFIIKMDKTGKALWGIAAGGKGDDHAMSCTTDKKGNIYVVGWFESKSITFGSITLNNKTQKGCDMYVAKFSPSGDCIWARNAGGEGDNGNYSTIVLDKKNNVILSGIAGNIMDFGDGNKLTNKKSGMYIAKYSNDGNLLWVKGATKGECQGVSVDKDMNVFAAGLFSDTTSFDNLNLISTGGSDAFIVKFSPDGKAIWAKNFGGSGGEIASCEVDPKGTVYLGGSTFSKTIVTPQDTITNQGEMNAFMSKFDKKGNLLWAKATGKSNGADPANGAREFFVDELGNVFCTGSNWSEFEFAGKTIKNVASSEDIFLLKYDKNGKELWAVDYGGTGRNAGRGVTSDKNGNIFLTGSFDEKQLKIENHTLSNKGDSDIFIVKYRGDK
jgi:hypothetical protein